VLTTSGKSLRTQGTAETPATVAVTEAGACKGIPRDPEGSFTRGTPEAPAAPPMVAEEAGEAKERLV
jgi:hypothetical protein